MSDMKQNYVLGFMFSPRHDFVVLIKKAKPTWQAGLLNGVGGKIELVPGWRGWLLRRREPASRAMVREFWEETGVHTLQAEWQKFCTIRGNFGEVACFVARSAVVGIEVRSMTAELVLNVNSETFGHYPTIDNLPALVGLAKAKLTGHTGQVTIDYTNHGQ